MAQRRRQNKSFPVINQQLAQQPQQATQRIAPRQIATGSSVGEQSLGSDSNVRVNSSEGNITVNINDNPGILIGKQVGGF